MVVLGAFAATAVATLFAQATGLRAWRGRRPYEAAWTVALTLFALASAAMSVGVTTGWDAPTFRLFYLFGAVLGVPWLALGTVHLLAPATQARRAQWAVVFLSGLATGVVLVAPMHTVPTGTAIPPGREVFGPAPRLCAALGSSGATVVVVGGALWSAWRFARRRAAPGAARRALANLLIAAGTLLAGAAGLFQGRLGEDEAFVLALATGITVLYLGFLVATGPRARHTGVAGPPDRGMRAGRLSTGPAVPGG